MRPIRRVLIIQPYGIGDLLFVTPVLRALRLMPTVERVDLLLGSRTGEVVAANPHVDKIFVVDKDKLREQKPFYNFQFMWKLGAELKRGQYDLLLDYSIRGEHAFFGKFFLGISRRAGYDYKDRGFFHNIKIPIPEGFQGRHVAEFVCALAEAAGILVEDRFLEFFFEEHAKEKFEDKLGLELEKLSNDFIVVAPGGGVSWGRDAHLKQWSVINFSKLVHYLKKKIKFKSVCILGSAGERGLAEELSVLLQVPSTVLAGELSISQSAWIIGRSKLFLGNDGGLVHLAKAMNKPVIGIYGPVNPREYGPYPLAEDDVAVFKEPKNGQPGYYKFRYDQDDTSIQALTVEDAIQIIEPRI